MQGDQSVFTPAYAVYENNAPTKVALFNYVTDDTGASDVNAVISVGGITEGTTTATPSQVFVRYWYANSTAEQFDVSTPSPSLPFSTIPADFSVCYRSPGLDSPLPLEDPGRRTVRSPAR